MEMFSTSLCTVVLQALYHLQIITVAKKKKKAKGEKKLSSVSPKPMELLVNLGFYPFPLRHLASQ